MTIESREHLIAMWRYWQRCLDRRLHQLATGTKPSSTQLADPIDNPAMMAGIAATAKLWRPGHAVVL